MSRNMRIALVVLAAVVAAVAFVLAKPGDDEGDGDRTTARTAERTGTEREVPPKPKVTRIRLRQGSVAGGAKTIRASSGETVRIVVASDTPDELHLHGYDITRKAVPGKPARFVFRTKAEGLFEMESHTAEDAGREPLVAKLEVNPS